MNDKNQVITMNKTNTLEQLRQCFVGVIPTIDCRTAIAPLEFVINLIFCYLGDSQCASIESIRRYMKAQTQKKISNGSFWERMSRKRLSLSDFLISAITELLRPFHLEPPPLVVDAE